jgi:hypothetical protein
MSKEVNVRVSVNLPDELYEEARSIAAGNEFLWKRLSRLRWPAILQLGGVFVNGPLAAIAISF